jgi:hypothetical protein
MHACVAKEGKQERKSKEKVERKKLKMKNEKGGKK